ncbi:MAG: twin transmembrane helix small protein [Chromatiaceae bacterium]|nr:twin transmembrane helix small protein [Gammaproteobacteria bacterium]MCP5300132.1 twin transmembrane helix small protein [Chromatiaceae bacterium]MCP5422204.1 twin transmembrane helix small protein [Chromatiaceae bacterium]
MKVVILIVFLGIIASLASGLYYLVNDRGDSRRTLRALTLRIGLSVGLFAFLMLLIGLGVIKPHGVYPEQAPGDATQQTRPTS